MTSKKTSGQRQVLESEIAVLRDTFRRLIRRKAKTNLAKVLSKTHPADLSLLFRQFTPDEQIFTFELVKQTEMIGEFITELDASIAQELLTPLEPAEIAKLLEKLSADERADILHLLPEEKAEAILETLRHEESEKLEELLAYPPDTAGGIMSVDVFSLPETTKAGDAIKAIQSSEHAEMVFYLYVTDETERLKGVVSLRELVTVHPDTELKSIMTPHVISATPETDQEEVARMVSKYNLLALPVVNKDGTLLGIVTVDDVVDVIRQEATEDFLKMAGVGKDREILMKSTWENVRLRLPWLFATWIAGVIISWFSGFFAPVILSTVALPAFIPVIMGMGGNIGIQSSTIIIRGLATGRAQLGHLTKVIFREIRVGLLLGIFYGILLGLVAKFRYIDAPPQLGLVVGSAISISMLLATCMGTLVPIFLRKLNIDPAIASGPFVTTTTDIVSLLSYFWIASLLMHIA